VTSFEFTAPVRILFGSGKIKELGLAAAGMGSRVLLVSGLSPERTLPVAELLTESGLHLAQFSVRGEPTVEDARQAAALASAQGCDLVVGLGGGSAIDTAKAAAALLTNPGDVYDYLEVIGSGKTITKAPAPCIAVPTTAGTGAEVTRNAVLGASEQRVKVSMRSPLMLPRLALVDPELTLSLPPSLTASTGLDALTQLIEPYLSIRANPLTDALCREGIPRAAHALPQVYHRGQDLHFRTEMSLASLFGGLALANAGLGAVHGFAAPLGGLLDAPHLALCARLLPGVFRTNLSALIERQPENPVLDRFTEVARMLTGDQQAQPEDAVVWLQRMVEELGIPLLSDCGLDGAGLPELVEKASQASSMKANPIVLTPQELLDILEGAL
jgi:alcohol dehydrogenase class IV